MKLAFDKSARSLSVDGHLHVALTNISKANVCPYYGREIPDYEALGLDPDKTYQLLRHPDELAKAAPTFAGKPLLDEHIPVSADAHLPDITVGSIGTDVTFEAPYLKASLTVWTQDAIDAIENGDAKELSCAYRYTADMSPGTYEGLRFDGVMRDIIGNHVALVPEGRAGPDVVVGDSMPLKSRKALMVSGALTALLTPKLAADAKGKVRFAGALDGVTAANFSEKRPAILAKVKTLTKGKLAADADLDDVVGLLDALENVTDGEVDDDMVETATAAGGGEGDDEDKPAVDADGDKMAELMAFLKGKLSDEDMAAASKLMGDDADTPAEDNEKPPAMDAAAIRRETLREAAAIRDAERIVRPIIGELVVAQDSAAAVYKLALDHRKIGTKGVHPSAYRALVEMAVAQDAAPTRAPAGRIAQDAASTAQAWLDGITKPAAAA